MPEAVHRLLIIDTCGIESSIALACAGVTTRILASERLPGRSASERLLPGIRALLLRSRADLPSLAAIVVVHGPGSFTGVRVGLSAAKGLCEAVQVPLIAISRLAVLAGKVDSDCLALLDAGRGEFYAGRYCNETCHGELLCNREWVVAELSAHAGLQAAACEPALAETLGEVARVILVPELTPADALPIAARRLRAGEFNDAAALDANYLRRTDSEIFAKPVRIAPALA